MDTNSAAEQVNAGQPPAEERSENRMKKILIEKCVIEETASGARVTLLSAAGYADADGVFHSERCIGKSYIDKSGDRDVRPRKEAGDGGEAA